MISKPKPKTASLYLRDMPRNVRDLFKAHCSKRGTSMTAKVVEFMRKCIEEDAAAAGGD